MGPRRRPRRCRWSARAADVLDADGAGRDATSRQELIANLPTNRDINASLLLAPAVHPTGPAATTRSPARCRSKTCSWSTASSVNENLRGQAAQPLHRGRDPGDDDRDRRHLGRVRPVHRRRGQRRHQVGRQHVQRIVPRHAEQRQVARADAVRRRASATRRTTTTRSTRSSRPTSTPSAGRCSGPALVLHRGPDPDAGDGPAARGHRTFRTRTQRAQRYEGNGTFSLNSNHRFQGAYIKDQLAAGEQHVQPRPRWT